MYAPQLRGLGDASRDELIRQAIVELLANGARFGPGGSVGVTGIASPVSFAELERVWGSRLPRYGELWEGKPDAWHTVETSVLPPAPDAAYVFGTGPARGEGIGPDPTVAVIRTENGLVPATAQGMALVQAARQSAPGASERGPSHIGSIIAAVLGVVLLLKGMRRIR